MDKRNNGVIVSIQRLDKKEMSEFAMRVMDLKNQVCPHGKGTIVCGATSKLGGMTPKVLSIKSSDRKIDVK